MLDKLLQRHIQKLELHSFYVCVFYFQEKVDDERSDKDETDESEEEEEEVKDKNHSRKNGPMQNGHTIHNNNHRKTE